jgi:hypothetical protein
VTASGRLPSTLVTGLGRLARPAPVQQTEKCELCGRPLSDEHRHLLELNERRILCACEPCLAMKSGLENYCPVSTRTLWLDDFVFPDELWSAFQLPVGLAFFMCELHLESWDKLVELNPILLDLEADAEALVVNRMVGAHQHAIVPIDECYRLVGLIKSTWQGISGGNAIEDAVPKFFDYVRDKAGVT